MTHNGKEKSPSSLTGTPRLLGVKDTPTGLPSNALPVWKKLPLDAKLPMVPGMSEDVVLSRRHALNPLHVSYRNKEFDLTDLNNYHSSSPKYDLLHDPHAKDYLKRPENLKNVEKQKLLTTNAEVPCSLKEYNEYRRYLHRLQGMQSDEEFRKEIERQKQAKADEDRERKEKSRKQKSRLAAARTRDRLQLDLSVSRLKYAQKQMDKEEQLKRFADDRAARRAERDAMRLMEWEKRYYRAKAQKRLDHWRRVQQLRISLENEKKKGKKVEEIRQKERLEHSEEKKRRWIDRWHHEKQKIEDNDAKMKLETEEFSKRVKARKKKLAQLWQKHQVTEPSRPSSETLLTEMAKPDLENRKRGESCHTTEDPEILQIPLNEYQPDVNPYCTQLNCNTSMFIRYKRTNIYLVDYTRDCKAATESKSMLDFIFHENVPTMPANVESTSDCLVNWVIKSSLNEYVDVADAVWFALVELSIESVNVQLQNTLENRCRLRLRRRSDNALLKWVADRAAESAICLVISGMSHLLNVGRLPTASLLTTMATRARQMILDATWLDLTQQATDRTESVVRHLWREAVRLAKREVDRHMMMMTLSWVRDRSPSLAGVQSDDTTPCAIALLITAAGVVLSLCGSYLGESLVEMSNIPKDKEEGVVKVSHFLPVRLTNSMVAWVDSRLWYLLNKIDRIPSPHHMRRIVLGVVRQMIKHAHSNVRQFLPPNHNQSCEEILVDCILDNVVGHLQQKLLMHDVVDLSNNLKSEDQSILDWLKRLNDKAATISDNIMETLEKQSEVQSPQKRKVIANDLSVQIIETTQLSSNEEEEVNQLNKYKLLHLTHLDQIIGSVTLMAESLSLDGVVPPKAMLAEIGFSLASQAATRVVQDLQIASFVPTMLPKCRTFLDYICSGLADKIRQKGKEQLCRLANIYENASFEKVTTTDVLEMELLHEVLEKLQEILDADRQESIVRNMEAVVIDPGKLHETMSREWKLVVQEILNSVRVQVESLLKDSAIPQQKMVDELLQAAIATAVPEAARELELSLRCLMTNDGCSEENMEPLLQEIVSQVLHKTCSCLHNEASREQTAAEVCISKSATTLTRNDTGCEYRESKTQTSTELYTAIKDHRLSDAIVCIQNGIAKQIIELAEDITLQDSGELKIIDMDKFEELSYAILMHVLQEVEEEVYTSGQDLVAVWESPLLERILKEAARIIQFWEEDNKLIIDGLRDMLGNGKCFSLNEWTQSPPKVNGDFLFDMEGFEIEESIVDFETSEDISSSERCYNKSDGLVDSSKSTEIDKQNAVGMPNEVFTCGMTNTPEHRLTTPPDSVMEYQVGHGFINKVLSTQILMEFERKRNLAVLKEDSVKREEIDCMCSDEDRQFIWSIAALLFPVMSLMEAEEIEKLHTAVHKFASNTLQPPRCVDKSAEIDDAQIELLECQISAIVYNVIHSNAVQSQLSLDTMTTHESLDTLNAVVIEESTKLLVEELKSTYNGGVLNLLETCRDEIQVMLTEMMVAHFPLLSHSPLNHNNDWQLRSIEFNEATSQLVLSVVDDMREQVNSIVKEKTEMIRCVDELKIQLQNTSKSILDATKAIEEKFKNEECQICNGVFDAKRIAAKAVQSACDHQEVGGCAQEGGQNVKSILNRVKEGIGIQVLTTRITVALLVQKVRTKLKNLAEELKHKVHIDACFYMYEILPPTTASIKTDIDLEEPRLTMLKRWNSLNDGLYVISDSEIESLVSSNKILSMDEITIKNATNLSPTYRSLEELCKSKSTSTTSDSGVRLASSCVSLSSKRDGTEDGQFKAINDSLDCFLTQQMLKKSTTQLQEEYLDQNNKVGAKMQRESVNPMRDLFKEMLLKQVTENLRREIMMKEDLPPALQWDVNHSQKRTTSSVTRLRNAAINNVVKETLVTLVETMENKFFSDMLLKKTDQLGPAKEVSDASVYLTRSQNMLIASVFCQTQRTAMRWLARKPLRSMPAELLDKCAKRLTDKTIRQTRMLLRQNKKRVSGCKTDSLHVVLHNILHGLEDELNFGPAALKTRPVPEALAQLTRLLLEAVCHMLREWLLIETAEHVIPHEIMAFKTSGVSTVMSRHHSKRLSQSKVTVNKSLTSLSMLPTLVQLGPNTLSTNEIRDENTIAIQNPIRCSSSTTSLNSSHSRCSRLTDFLDSSATPPSASPSQDVGQIPEKVTKWVMHKLLEESIQNPINGKKRASSSPSPSSRSTTDDRFLLRALDGVIASLKEQKQHLLFRLRRATRQGQVPPQWTGNPNRKPSPPPTVTRDFSTITPLLESEATSEDIFDAVLEMVANDHHNSQSGSGMPAATDSPLGPSTSSPRLLPIFEGKELDLEPADIEQGLSAISMKHVSLSDLKMNECVAHRNSFRNILRPDLTSLPLTIKKDSSSSSSSSSNSSSSGGSSQSMVKTFIQQVAGICKSSTSSNKCPTEETTASLHYGVLSKTNIAVQPLLPKKAMTTVPTKPSIPNTTEKSIPDTIQSQPNQSRTESYYSFPSGSNSPPSRSNGAVFCKSKKLDQKPLSAKAQGGSDTLMEPASKSALVRLVGLQKEPLILENARSSLGGAESHELSRIDEMVVKESAVGFDQNWYDESDEEYEDVELVNSVIADTADCQQTEEYED